MIDAEGLYQAWLEEYGATAYQILGIPGSHWFGLFENGQIPASKIEEIAEIATGRLPRRRNDDDIILYSVGGMPVEDVAWATDLYRVAEEKHRNCPEPLGHAGPRLNRRRRRNRPHRVCESQSLAFLPELNGLEPQGTRSE